MNLKRALQRAGGWLPALLLFWPSWAAAQSSVGVTVGGIVTSDFKEDRGGPYARNSQRLLIGPTVRVRTSSGFGVEAGALRKGFRFQYSAGRPGLGFTEYTADVTAWYFPVLAQYGRTAGRVKPYVEAGPVWRRITSGRQSGRNCTQLPTVVCTSYSNANVSSIRRRTTTGVVAGAGIEFGAAAIRRFLQFSTEVRYTRWLNQPFTAPATADNEVQLLLRIAFPISQQ